MLPMIPFYATVYVKMKKWHKEGGLAAPFVRGRLLCPCPLMSDGWVVELTDGKILHVREAVQPNMEAEELRPLPDADPEVALQLEEEPQPGRPTHRVVGKQPPTSEPQVPGPPRASHPTTGGGFFAFVNFAQGYIRWGCSCVVGPSARGQGGHLARPTAGLPYIVDGDFRKRCQGYENAGHGGGRRAGLCGEAAGEVGQGATGVGAST